MQCFFYSLPDLNQIPRFSHLSDAQLLAIRVVAQVFPFKVNNYVLEELIDWNEPEKDPVFKMTIPHRAMLHPDDYAKLADLINKSAPQKIINHEVNKIRLKMNPHPAGQMELNRPLWQGKKLRGIQHKYLETVLFFPSRGQTCHAYCTFCFRWPQFSGISRLKMAENETKNLVDYVGSHPEITDILITGGDPLIMKTSILQKIIHSLLVNKLKHVQNIRIGTKALSYWPYRFLTDKDASDLLQLFRLVNHSGKRLALMAHINHYQELQTTAVKQAVDRILETGTQIRTQAPILRNINDSANIWKKMWKQQVKMGMIPYYLFIPRNTGAQHYFALPLVEALKIFRLSYTQVSGLARTVRGPIMSSDPGKIEIMGTPVINDKKYIALQFIQGRNLDWVKRPFYAKYDAKAIWRTQLKPAWGDKFFYEQTT